MRQKFLRTALLSKVLFLSALPLACDSRTDFREPVEVLDVGGPEVDSVGTDVGDIAPTDTQFPEDSDSSMGSTGDSGSDSDVYYLRRYAGCPLSQKMAKNPYVCQSPDKETVRYRAIGSAYSQPNHPPVDVPMTLTEATQSFGGQLPQTGHIFALGRNLQPLVTHEAGYAEWGDDVTLHIATVHPRSEYKNTTIFFTALLNYQPTVSTYKHFSENRSEVLKQVTGRSIRIPLDGPIEIIEITIPAEAFDSRGRYDLAFGWGNRGPVEFSDEWDSLDIYYGGCSPPKHKCAKPTKIREATQETLRVYKKYMATSFLHPAGKLDGENPFEPIEVKGGQTVEIEYAVLPMSNYNTTIMFVPFINGEPLDKRWHSEIPEFPDDGTGFLFAGRNQFRVRIPDEPGKYEVELASWYRPFLSADELRHKWAPNSSDGSNSLMFVVKE
jgi:hypothetical protein